jgi:hypothetical protein
VVKFWATPEAGLIVCPDAREISVTRFVNDVPIGTVTFISLRVVSIIPVAAGVTILKEVICLPGEITFTGSGVVSSFLHPFATNRKRKRNVVILKNDCFIVFDF